MTVSRADLGVLGTTTANGSGNWSYNYSGTTLPAGTYAFTATQTTGGVTSLPSSAYVVTVETGAPTVVLTVPSSTDSLDPTVLVTASDQGGISSSATVTIQQDVSGTWSNLTTGTLTGGMASIVLPAFASTGTYTLRAQVTNLAGNTGTSSSVNLVISSASSWSMTAQVLTADPQSGDATDQLGNVTQSLALDLDQSGGSASNGAALVYNSDSVSQEPVIQAVIQSPNNAALPASVTATLTWAGTTGATLTYNTTGLVKGNALVISAQVPSAVTTTGAYNWTLSVVANGNNLTASGTTYVVAEDSSPFGAGWTLAPMMQLYPVSTPPLGSSWPTAPAAGASSPAAAAVTPVRRGTTARCRAPTPTARPMARPGPSTAPATKRAGPAPTASPC